MKIINNKIERKKATFKVSISSTAKGFTFEILRYTNLKLTNEGVTPELRIEALSLESFIGENGDYSLNDITKSIKEAVFDLLKNETIISKKDSVVILDN
jgi:hypothetical protein